jgi:pimeloyl-ACP methyl ester carboxylesterase
LINIGQRRLHANVISHGNPVVLLESGIAASSLSWARVAPKVAEFATVVTYDRAGLGWSDPPPHRCTALDAVADLTLLLNKLGLPGPLIIAGHSFGGLIARLFQQRRPDRVAGLVLADPVVRAEWRNMTPMLARGAALSRRGAVLARLGVVSLGLRLLMSGSRNLPGSRSMAKMLARVSAGRGASVTERLAGEVRKMPPELWPAIAWHWSQAKSFRAMADSLESLPVSVAQLDEDRPVGDLPLVVLSAASARAQAAAEHEHDARLSTRGEHLVVPGSGHWMQLDAPEAIVDAIRRVTAQPGARAGVVRGPDQSSSV